MRSLPPFPVYSLGGDIDGGNWGGKNASGDCGNTGVARVGIGGLPGVLLIKICVLLRPRDIEGFGELGIILIVFSYICFWVSILILSVFFSAASAPINNRIEVLL